MVDAPKLLKLPESECPDMDTSTTAQVAEVMAQC